MAPGRSQREGAAVSFEIQSPIGEICILKIDSLHAAFRRRAHVRGTQSKGETFPELRADWLVQAARGRRDCIEDILSATTAGDGADGQGQTQFQRAPNAWH
eukprot:6566671-Pyramimonas_sp.AAC.1